MSKDALNSLNYQKMTQEEPKAGEMTVMEALMAIALVVIPSVTIVMVSKVQEVAVAEVEGATMVEVVEVEEEESNSGGWR